MPPSLQKSTLVDHVTQQLRQMIMDGEITPGEYLPSRKELADQFGVGLSTVHEAVQALTAVGMLQSRAGKGTWVRGDALDTLIPLHVVKHRLGDLNARQLYEARAVIEVVSFDDSDQLVEYGETGRVKLTTLTKEFFVPGFLERDEGERERPYQAYPWDGISGVRPFHGVASQTTVGVY